MAKNGTITISMGGPQFDVIDRLMMQGYGNSREEVVEYLVARELDDLRRAHVVPAGMDYHPK